MQQSTTNFTAKCYYNPLMFSKNAQAILKKQLLIEASENCTDHLKIQIQLEGTCHREGKKLLLKKLLKL